MMKPPSCKFCTLNGNLCELSLARNRFPLDSRCLECIEAGIDCCIPTDDRTLLESGIETVGSTFHPGQRRCLNCAMGGKNCVFLQGHRPYPCVPCLRAGATACVVPPLLPGSVSPEPTNNFSGGMYSTSDSAQYPSTEYQTPVDQDLINQAFETQSLEGLVPSVYQWPREDNSSQDLFPRSNPVSQNYFNVFDLEQEAYLPAGGTRMKDKLATKLLSRRKHKHSPDPEDWLHWIDEDFERRMSS